MEQVRNPVALSVIAISMTAWILLWGWDNSNYAGYASHVGWLDGSAVGHLCRSDSAVGLTITVGLHLLGWMLMMIAMMLATIIPLLNLFCRLTQARRNRDGLVALLIAGYLAAWLLFGILAHGADTALHAVVERIGWLSMRAWLPGALILATAGAYQLSALKGKCLSQCRSPLFFITRRWHGTHERRASFAIGFHHGVFCIGCCWALMLLMFALGTASIAWMLAIAVVMGAEKTLAWGARLRMPLGVALLSWAALIAAANV